MLIHIWIVTNLTTITLCLVIHIPLAFSLLDMMRDKIARNLFVLRSQLEVKISNLILYSAKRARRYSRPLAQWLTRRPFVVTTIQRPLTREHTQLGIADFDEIRHECSFRKNIRPVFFFIGNGWCWRGENYPQSWGSETYFVKYLGNYWRYRFCVNWWNLCFLTTNVMVYTILQKNLLFKQYM